MKDAHPLHSVMSDVNSICRCCLTRNASKSIYDACGSHGNRYSFMISSYTPISIQENDGLPNGLCEACTIQLQNAFKFYMQCSKSSGHLADMGPATNVKMENIRSETIKQKQEGDCELPTLAALQ